MNVKDVLEKIMKEDKKINSFLEFNESVEYNKKGVLSGKSIGIKSNISVKGMKVSCASKVLEDYKAPFDATVVKKIKDEGGAIIGMLNMDEFACGSSGETSAFGPTRNPVNLNFITGGSSSGSAAAVASGFCEMALGSDTGGSIRNPASYCGVVGVKPSYGRVSRYGLIDLGMSLDVIGPLARNVSNAALLLKVIEGPDEFDAITESFSPLDLKKIENIPSGITVGVLDLDGLKVDKRIFELFEKNIKKIISEYGWNTKKIKLQNLSLAVETYYPLVYVEFFSGTRKFDGRRYGKRIEKFAGPEVLRRILGGKEISKEEYSGRYYHRALKAKKLIGDDFRKIFSKGVDCIISPTVPRLPWKIGEKISVEEAYSSDILTIPPSLAGNCAVSVPMGDIEGFPVGMQIVCDRFEDEKMLQIARSVEKVL